MSGKRVALTVSRRVFVSGPAEMGKAINSGV
jgi:hypothetical protein